MISSSKLASRIWRSLRFRAQSAKRLVLNAGKHLRATRALERRTLLDCADRYGTKDELLNAGRDAVWIAAPGEIVSATSSRKVQASAGAGNREALEASLAETSFETPAIAFGRFRDCIAEPHSVRLVDAAGQLVSETSAVYDLLDPAYRDSGHLLHTDRQTSLLEKTYPVIDCDAILPFNAFTPSYGHYLLTALPALLCFRDEIVRGALKVIVPIDYPGWMTALLREMGIDERHVLQTRHQPYRFRSAIVSSILDAGNTRAPNPASIRWLQTSIGEEPKHHSVSPHIFVRRSAQGNVSSRTIQNEDRIAAALEQKGFAIIEPAAMPLSNQIAAFRDARMIVSPHGSTLANLVFCRPGARVVDLMPDSWVGARGDRLRDVWAARICSLAGLDYSVLLSPSKVLERHYTGNPTIVSEVPVPDLLKCIDG